MDPITYQGKLFAGKPLTLDAAEEIFEQKLTPKSLNRSLVAATFSLPADSIGALDFPLYQRLLDATLDLNELRPKGEATASLSTSAS